MFFSLYILLNSCIGFSSAPFYEKNLSCHRIEPSDDCTVLRTLTTIMYGIEMCGAFILVVHGVLCFACADYIKNLKLARILIKLSKIFLIIYVVLIVCRGAVYLKVHSQV